MRFAKQSPVILALLVSAAKATNNFAGVNFANSAGGATSYTCRTEAQWNQAAATIKAQGFNQMRLVGFDCNALELASAAAAAANIKILAGIYIHGKVVDAIPQINAEVQTFLAAYKKYGSQLYTGLTIGNEVNDTPANIMAKVYDVRGYLQSQGVTTPISTVHVWVHIRDNPALCGADFVGANAHPYYDGHFRAQQSGDFLFQIVVPSLIKACPGKKVYITETGWPEKGAAIGAAVPSLQNQYDALLNINCAITTNRNVSVFAFEYDNQMWKGSDAERSYGMVGKYCLNGPGGAFNFC